MTRTLENGTMIKGGMSVLEIVFVGQCEMFVCLHFVGLFFFFFFFFFPLVREQGVNSLKDVDFSDTYPLKQISSSNESLILLMINIFSFPVGR